MWADEITYAKFQEDLLSPDPEYATFLPRDNSKRKEAKGIGLTPGEYDQFHSIHPEYQQKLKDAIFNETMSAQFVEDLLKSSDEEIISILDQ